MGLSPVDQFVLSVGRWHESEIDKIKSAVYNWVDRTLVINIRGYGGCDEPLRMIPDIQTILRPMAHEAALEFVDKVVRRLFKQLDWTDLSIERADIGDDEQVPEIGRCTTTWFLKIRGKR